MITIRAVCSAHERGDYEIGERGPKSMEKMMRAAVNAAIFKHMRDHNCDGKKITITVEEAPR